MPGRFLVATILLLVISSASAADDTVYIAGPASKPGVQKQLGKIADYTGRELRLVVGGGQERKFPAGRVVRIEYTKSGAQQSADQAFAAGDFAGAAERYEAALAGKQENRSWVRRAIMAQLVRCCVELERWELAGERFLLVAHDDPELLQIDAIPLAWITAQPSATLEQQAKKWLAAENNPIANLIGASHLLPTAEQATAQAALQRVSKVGDKRLAALAAAQLWRTQLVTATPQAVDRWTEHIAAMSEGLRAGPLYTSASAMARHEPVAAAFGLLRVAVLYPAQQRLATRSAEQAAAALENIDPNSAALIRARLKERPSLADMRGTRETSEDERFVAGLREWRLFALAESYCQRQLAQADLPEAAQAELTAALILTLCEHAAELPPGDRAQLWEAARQAGDSFAARHVESERLLLVRTQQAIALATQAHLLLEESQFAGEPNKLIEPAQELIRLAISSLKQLETDAADQVRMRQQGITAKASLTLEELNQLRTRIQFALGHALLVQGQTYAAESDDRINSLSQAIESLAQVGQLYEADSLTWNARLEEAMAHRLMGRNRHALGLLTRMQGASTPPELTPRILAQQIRCHLAQDNAPAALKIIQSTTPESLPGSGDFDLAQLEAYLAAWRAAKEKKDDQQASKWEEVAARVVRQMEERDGGYWAHRGEALLATIVARTPAGDPDSLARSATNFQRAGKPEDALAAYDKAITEAKSAGPSDKLFELCVAAGLVEHGQKHFQESSRRLREAALLVPNHIKAADAHLVAIQDAAAWAQQQDPPALDEYRALLDEHLQHWPDAKTAGQVAWWLGQLLVQQAQWKDAAEAFLRVPADHAKAADAIGSLSICYDHLLDAEQAAGKSIDAHAAELAGEFQRQLPAVNSTADETWTPAMRSAAMGAARMWLRAGEKGAVQAERVLRAALDAATDAPADWRSAAMALLTTSYVQQRRMGDAGKMLAEVASGSPEDLLRLLDSISNSPQNTSAEQRRRLAQLQLQIIELLDRQNTKLNEATQLQLAKLGALALLQTGKTAEALTALEEIADKLPDDGVVQEEFASLLSQSKDKEQLQSALARWRDLERKSRPGSSRWFRANLGAARMQLALGNKSQARATIKLTQATRPDLGGEESKREFLELLKEIERN